MTEEKQLASAHQSAKRTLKRHRDKLLASDLRRTGIRRQSLAPLIAVFLTWWMRDRSSITDLPLPSLSDVSPEYIVRNAEQIVDQIGINDADFFAASLQELLTVKEVEAARACVLKYFSYEGVGTTPNDDKELEEFSEAILQYCYPQIWLGDVGTGILMELLGSQKGDKIECAFRNATKAAWILSKAATVELSIDDVDLACVVRSLAEACALNLNVVTRNLKQVSRAGGNLDFFREIQRSIVAAPIGGRVEHEQLDLPSMRSHATPQISSEAFASLWAGNLGSACNLVVVSDGFLSRTTSTESHVKEQLVATMGLSRVVALPMSTFSENRGVAFSALVLDPTRSRDDASATIEMIDAREDGKYEVHRSLRTRHISDFKSRCVPVSELARNDYNLVVDRYVLDEASEAALKRLERSDTIALGEVAEVFRAQAIPKIKRGQEFRTVREVQLSDIDDGLVLLPTRTREFPAVEIHQLERVRLEHNDILLSVRGTVGKVGIVSEKTIEASDGLPLIPNQSCVVIRINSYPGLESEFLAAYLRTTVAQSILSSKAGGTKVQNVPMAEIRSLPVIVPALHHQLEFLQVYQQLKFDIERARREILEAKANELDLIEKTLSY